MSTIPSDSSRIVKCFEQKILTRFTRLLGIYHIATFVWPPKTLSSLGKQLKEPCLFHGWDVGLKKIKELLQATSNNANYLTLVMKKKPKVFIKWTSEEFNWRHFDCLFIFVKYLLCLCLLWSHPNLSKTHKNCFPSSNSLLQT